MCVGYFRIGGKSHNFEHGCKKHLNCRTKGLEPQYRADFFYWFQGFGGIEGDSYKILCMKIKKNQT